MPSQIILDKANFPLIWIEPIQAYIHLLPITKLQFENYIADYRYVQNAGFYLDAIKLNPRIPPYGFSVDNYWRLFVTGLTITEIRGFIGWEGSDFGLPSSEEWIKTNQYLCNIDSNEVLAKVKAERRINRFAKVILSKLDNIIKPKSALDLSLQFNCFLEWVQSKGENNKYSVIGRPNTQLFPMIQEKVLKEIPVFDYERRTAHFGFRLINRSKLWK